MPQTSIVGALCGTDTFNYDSFVDSNGRTVEGGTSLSVYVGTGLDTAPVKVKCNREQFDALTGLGFGADVALLCTPFAKGRRVEYRLDTIGQPAKA